MSLRCGHGEAFYIGEPCVELESDQWLTWSSFKRNRDTLELGSIFFFCKKTNKAVFINVRHRGPPGANTPT